MTETKLDRLDKSLIAVALSLQEDGLPPCPASDVLDLVRPMLDRNPSWPIPWATRAHPGISLEWHVEVGTLGVLFEMDQDCSAVRVKLGEPTVIHHMSWKHLEEHLKRMF